MPSAARVQWAKIRVGAVTASALLILGTLCVLLTGGTFLEPKSTIYLYMPDAVALVAGAPVRVDGITVGKVETVALTGLKQPDRIVKVTMKIERDRLASIPDDSTAQASTQTLAGDKFVDITSGDSPTRVKPGSEIIYKPPADMMKRLDVSQFEERLRVIDALITEMEEGKTLLGKFVQGDEMYLSLRRRLSDLQKGIRSAAATTSDLGKAIHTDELYRQISDPLRELDQSIARVQSGQGPLGQFLRDNAQYDQLRDSLGALRKSMQELRGNDFMRTDQQYADWIRGVRSMTRMVDDFSANPMLATTASYDNVNGMAKELQSTLKEFRENPRKFLRLKVF